MSKGVLKNYDWFFNHTTDAISQECRIINNSVI